MHSFLQRVKFKGTVDFLREPTFKGLSAPIIRSAYRLVTSAELLALNGTPLTLVAAPGAGKMLVPEAIDLFMDYNTTAYDGVASGEDLAVRYTDGSGGIGLTIETTGFLDQSSDQRRYQQLGAVITPVPNAALVLHMTTGNIATGNSPLYVRLYYKELTAL